MYVCYNKPGNKITLNLSLLLIVFLCGILQAEKAYQYLTDMVDATALNVQFVIDCGNGARGIYLRELHEVTRPSEFSVSVEPKFLESKAGCY